MVQNVISLHSIVGADDNDNDNHDVRFPYSLKDYQRYVFGDDRLAHRFGTDLAKKAIIPTLSRPTDDFAVAVLSEDLPTSTHSLRDHFVAYLNRHLIANNAAPALKLDLHCGAQKGRHEPRTQAKRDAYHIDAERLGGRSIILLADIRTSREREEQIRVSLSQKRIPNTITFAYLLSLEDSKAASSLSPFLSSVINPSLKDMEIIAQATHFVMNECFVRFVLGRDNAEFCQFIRRQDDHFARSLLDHAICGYYYNDEDHKLNVEFLLWEIETRESM